MPEPPAKGTGMGEETCKLQINLASGNNVLSADGACYTDKVPDRVCCKNLSVLGVSGTGAVTIDQSCPGVQHCCIVKALVEGITGTVNVQC